MLHAVNWDYSCTRPDAWFNRFAHCPLRPSTGDWYKYSSPQVRIYRCSAFCPSVLYIKSSWAYFWCLDRCTTATVVTRLRCYSDNQEKDLSCTESCLFFFFFFPNTFLSEVAWIHQSRISKCRVIACKCSLSPPAPSATIGLCSCLSQ